MFDAFFGTFLLIGGQLQFRLALTNQEWGWAWLGTGLLLMAGSLFKRDGLFFAAAVFIKVCWALEYFRIAFIHDDHTNWARGAYFMCLALLVVVASAWPEPPKLDDNNAVIRAQRNQDGGENVGSLYHPGSGRHCGLRVVLLRD
jgi:hypothetical protein